MFKSSNKSALRGADGFRKPFDFKGLLLLGMSESSNKCRRDRDGKFHKSFDSKGLLLLGM